MAVDVPADGGVGMGLGPPVCDNCKVLCRMIDKKWICKYCKQKPTESLLTCGLTIKQLKANEKFLDLFYDRTKKKRR